MFIGYVEADGASGMEATETGSVIQLKVGKSCQVLTLVVRLANIVLNALALATITVPDGKIRLKIGKVCPHTCN
eukprot:SAG31_NODE_3079_length_4706_cov_3.887779_5_plen_74_part_00